MATSGKKSREDNRLTKVRAPNAEMKWRLYGENTVAPLCRKSSGSFMPKAKWLHNAENSHKITNSAYRHDGRSLHA
jgi:hypothetical protein